MFLSLHLTYFSSIRACILWILAITISEATVLAQQKPAIIVLTDIGGDSDDEQSLVRLLLHSDQVDLKAICATSRLGHGHDTRPELIRNQIKAYGQVYPNLILHSKTYPSPDYLESIVFDGQGDPEKFGEGYDTEASRAIVDIIDKESSLTYIVVWGGQRELAQALWAARAVKSKEEMASFCKKIQVHAIGDQDKHRDWIIDNFRDIRYVASGFIFPGNFGLRQVATFRGMYMTGDVSMQDRKWVETNVHGHGPLSDLYPLDGHGTDGMKEGDSPSFLGLLINGLNIPDKPEWGGWGGRYRLLSGNLYIDAHDFMDGTLNERHTVSRWRPAFQNAFCARLDWCTKSYAEANHFPEVTLNGLSGNKPLEIQAKPGETLRFDARRTTDPDGDKLSFRWLLYNELIGGNTCIPIKTTAKGQKCAVKLPQTLPGNTVHLILEVTDNGTPNLTSYRRIVINTNP